MIYLLGCLLFIAGSTAVLRRSNVLYAYSKGIGLAIALSLLANICLAQNYTQSLIPEANDGIGISNQIAYWIIGDDRWTHELFKNSFEQSVYFTFLLMVVYLLVLVMESTTRRKAI